MSPTTYTYDNGAQETFNLIRGPQTPEGYVVASFKYSDGEVSDGYVSLEWLRNRLDELSPVTTNRRAEQAEQERDEARRKVAEYVSLLAAPPTHPLTADDITKADTSEHTSTSPHTESNTGAEMTYTADDFALARFATHPSGRSTALRAHPHSISPWLTAPEETDALATRLSDARLAEFGWVPVQENPRPLSPDDITDEMVERAEEAYMWNDTRGHRAAVTAALVSALTEPASRPENAEDIEQAMKEFDGYFEAYGFAGLADHLAGKGFQFVPDPRSYCGLGPCCLEDGHSGSCTM